MSDWRDLFCGRSAELESLRDAYDAVAAGAGPRTVVVLGDRGMGKTRLVGEFYAFLTRERDPENYWPDASLFRGRNLLVGPDVERDPAVRDHFAGFALGTRRMSFLWWGIRLADADDRNAAPTDLATHRRFLDVHLEPLRQSRRLEANRGALTELRRDAAKSGVMKAVELIPFVGGAIGLLVEGALFTRSVAKLRGERKAMLERHRSEQVARLARVRADDILGATLADLEALFSGGEPPDRDRDPAAPTLARVPLVLFVDDAQFARPGGDEGVLELVWELWQRAVAGRWPLLLVAAHWEREWRNAVTGADGDLAGRFRPLLEATDGWEPIVLGKEPELEGLVRAALPGMLPADVALVLDRADGNPQLLIEIVERIRRSPAWRAAGGALSADGRRQLATAGFDLHRLIRERMESDSTPDEVRRAVAVSSVQGMEFSCTLAEAVATLLNAGPVREGLEEAEESHRYVLGVDRGVAAFLQRAYREAALGLVGGQLGSLEVVNAALARAADAFLDDEARWATLNESERDAVLALRATLGEASADAATRARAAVAMARLATRALTADPEAADVPGAARWARRLAAGLADGRWPADVVALDDLALIADGLREWDGAGAALPLLSALAERTRTERGAGANGSPRELVPRLLILVDGLRAAGRFEEADEVTREVLEIARDLVRREPSFEHRRLLFGVLSSEAKRLREERIEDALQVLLEQYELGRAMAEDRPADFDVRRDWAHCAIHFAHCLNLWRSKALDLPLELLLPARADLRDLVEGRSDLLDLRLLGHLDLEIGRTLLRRREPADADAYFRNAIEALRLAYATQPRYIFRRSLLEALSTTAEAEWERGERERAMERLREARTAMEGASPPPDLTHGILQMKLYHRMVEWGLHSSVEADARAERIEGEVADLLGAARALLPHVPVAAGVCAEMTGRVAGELWARAAIEGAAGDPVRARVDAMRGEALSVFRELDKEWALLDWFETGLGVIDEHLRDATAAGDASRAATLAVAALRWALGYRESVADDDALGALLYWIIVAGHEVLDADHGLEPELVRSCARAAVAPWQDPEPYERFAWSRAPALAVLATLGADIPADERDALVRAAGEAFEADPSWMGRLAGYEMEIELALIPDDPAARCRVLDAFAEGLRSEAGEEGIAARIEWRWLERLRRRWGCAAPKQGPAPDAAAGGEAG